MVESIDEGVLHGHLSGVELWRSIYFRTAEVREPLESDDDVKDFGQCVLEGFKEEASDIETHLNGKFDLSNDELDRDKDRMGDFVFKKDKRYVRCPSFYLNEAELKNFEIRIDINPCVGSSPTTKIYAIPLMEIKDKIDPEQIIAFYDRIEKKTEEICVYIAKTYHKIIISCEKEKIREIFDEKDFNKIPRYDLTAHVVGHNADYMMNLIDDSDSIDKIENLKKHNMDVKNVVDNLMVKLASRTPNSKSIKNYEWITQRTDYDGIGLRGLFGFYGDESVGHIVGVTHKYPHRTTTNLMMELIKTI
ncbi:MAG: hypothetical protein ABW168_07350 [Sedimenticola sp.]